MIVAQSNERTMRTRSRGDAERAGQMDNEWLWDWRKQWHAGEASMTRSAPPRLRVNHYFGEE